MEVGGTGAGSAPSACRDIFPQKVRKSKNVTTAAVILTQDHGEINSISHVTLHCYGREGYNNGRLQYKMLI